MKELETSQRMEMLLKRVVIAEAALETMLCCLSLSQEQIRIARKSLDRCREISAQFDELYPRPNPE